MNYSDQLYILIHSLSANEKRYFTLHAKQFSNDTKSNALKLFDALCKYKATQYDEQAFIKQNKTKTFCKNLAYEKTNLNDLILKTMRSYHADKNTDYHHFINNIDIKFLIEKGLTDQALKLIHKSYELAKEKKDYYQLLQLITFKQFFIAKKLIKVNYQDFSSEFNDIIEKISERTYWYNMRLRVYELLEQLNNAEKLLELQSIITQIELEHKENKLSSNIKNTALNILQTYYSKIFNYEKLLDVSLEILNEYELEENVKDYRVSMHLQIITNVLLAILYLERREEMLIYIDKVKNLKVESEYDKITQFKIYTQNMLLYKLNTKSFTDIEKFTDEIDKGIKKYQNQLSDLILLNFRFNVILVYFLSKKYDEVQVRIISFYKNVKYNEQSSYTYIMLNCLEILVLISAKAYDTADSLVRSWMRSNVDLFREEPVFKIIEKIIKHNSNPNFNLKESIDLLEKVENHIKWDQLKGLVMDWANYKIEKKIK
ncbi:MAG: hypothetical protein WCP57_09285 [Bacteroidota bacterium]